MHSCRKFLRHLLEILKLVCTHYLCVDCAHHVHYGHYVRVYGEHAVEFQTPGCPGDYMFQLGT